MTDAASLHISLWELAIFDWAEMSGTHKLSEWLDKHGDTVRS